MSRVDTWWEWASCAIGAGTMLVAVVVVLVVVIISTSVEWGTSLQHGMSGGLDNMSHYWEPFATEHEL